MPALGAVGRRSAGSPVCSSPAPSSLAPAPRGRRRAHRHSIAPLPPGVVGRHVAERVAGTPLAVVDPDLDLADAAVHRPGHAGERRRSPAGPRACRGTSIRACVLIGACCAQPRGDPVGVVGRPRRQLEVDDPLGRRHVAVEARARPGAPGSRARAGSGSPFMPTASIASRPSMIAATRRAAREAVGRRLTAAASAPACGRRPRPAGRRSGDAQPRARCRPGRHRPRSTRTISVT